MNAPLEQSGQQSGNQQPSPPPQSPMSEAVEQAGDAAQRCLEDLQHFAEREADILASGQYGLNDLTTAPLRLFGILMTNAVRGASTASDNLALLSLSGRFGAATARRAFRVYVGADNVLPGGTLKVSELVGSVNGYRIPPDKINIDLRALSDDGTVTITVQCAGVPPDTYTGTLSWEDPLHNALSQAIGVAIDEMGDPLT